MKAIKTIAAVLLTSGFVLGSMSTASAEGGCGYGHKNAEKKQSTPASS